MPLQNRVTPFGNIEAVPARGTFMGNRGGRIHDPQSHTLLSRRWASRRWIVCSLCFRDRHREVMGQGYTELFFLDEVTALAAGHRPCFECRRSRAEAFFAAHAAAAGEPAMRIGAERMDRLLHAERTGPCQSPLDPAHAPDATMFDLDGQAFARCGDWLLQWSHSGYRERISAAGMRPLVPLTPRLVIGILARGYQPEWHVSAG